MRFGFRSVTGSREKNRIDRDKIEVRRLSLI